jgi:hypothetical protein
VKNQRSKIARRFTGAGPRPDLTKLKREEAAERQAIYDALSTQQKLDRLPPAPQAAKQRAKLTALLEGKTKPPPKSESKPEAQQ